MFLYISGSLMYFFLAFCCGFALMLRVFVSVLRVLFFCGPRRLCFSFFLFVGTRACVGFGGCGGMAGFEVLGYAVRLAMLFVDLNRIPDPSGFAACRWVYPNLDVCCSVRCWVDIWSWFLSSGLSRVS